MFEFRQTGQLSSSKIKHCPVFTPNKLSTISQKLKLTESEVQFVAFKFSEFDQCLIPFFHKFFAGDQSLSFGFADIPPRDFYLWKYAKIGSNRYVKEVVNSCNRFTQVVKNLSQCKNINKSFLQMQNKLLRPKDKVLGIRKTIMRAGNPKSNPYAFYCTPLETIDDLFQELIDFINSDKEMNLNKSLISVLQFIFIHPYKDGNGRTSRALFLAMMQKTFSSTISCLFLLYLKNINRMSYYAAIADYRSGNVVTLRDFYLKCIKWVNKSTKVLNDLFETYTSFIDDNKQHSEKIIITIDKGNLIDFNDNIYHYFKKKGQNEIYINNALLNVLNQFDYYLRFELRECL